jgi:hypothetical protein
MYITVCVTGRRWLIVVSSAVVTIVVIASTSSWMRLTVIIVGR